MATGVTADFSKLCQLIKNLQKLDGTEVNAGYWEDDKYGADNNNLSVRYIASLHEHGFAGKFERRPFMSDTFRSNSNQMKLAKLQKEAVIASIRGRNTMPALNNIGQAAVNMIQESIKTYPGSNHPETVRKKGFDAPLRETLRLLQSAKFKIKQ